SWEQVGAAFFSSYDINLAFDSNSRPYVAYQDCRDYADGYGCKASVMSFNGASWEQVGAAGFSPDSAYDISLALDSSGRPYVAFNYWDSTNNSYKVGVMRFNGTSWEQVGAAGFSSDSVYYDSIQLALDSRGTPYVAFRYWDNTNNSSKIGVMRFVPDIAITPVYELLLLKKKQ
ncbi:MAG: hypothetical protein D3905_13785, partial [Candidatus Electrothrix sp. AS4_5]|nr:hypothetical protein [Candidatus Electrothrix gigas]